MTAALTAAKMIAERTVHHGTRAQREGGSEIKTVYDSGVTETPEKLSLSIVIVSWESGADLVECVRSLAGARAAVDPPLELIVVDNASRDFSPEAVHALWPAATLIRNETNRGFGPAANQGVAAAHADIALLLNPDTRAVDDPLSPLLQAFANHPEAVAVAPRLFESETSPEHRLRVHQLRRLPTVGQVARQMLLIDRVFPRNRWLARDWYLERDQAQPFAVEQPAAAALGVRRGVFMRLGGFDETFVPAWFEDVDLCARLLGEGPILYWPESRFVHAGAGAARALGYASFLPIYHRNALRCWRKHHGRASSAACRALVAVGMVLRLLVLPLRPTLPCSRGDAARAYARVLLASLGLVPWVRTEAADRGSLEGARAARPLIARLPGGPEGRLARLVLSSAAGFRLLIKSGPLAFGRRLVERFSGRAAAREEPSPAARYDEWWHQHVAQTAPSGQARASSLAPPTFSVLMPVFNPPLPFLRAAVNSVRRQSYPHWELLLADDGSRPEVREQLAAMARPDARVRVVSDGDAHGIAAATNRAFAAATGDWIGFLDHDDLLAPTALAEVAAALAREPALEALYTDRDSVDEQGRHLEPYFKPDWSPAALLSHNYAIHFLALRHGLMDALGGLRSAFDGAQDYDLVLRLAEQTDSVGHLPRVLYSWRRHAGSNLGSPRPQAFEAGRRAIADALARRGHSGRVELASPTGPYRTWLTPRGEPLVSIIASSRDPSLLESCLAALMARTRYPRVETLVATNAVGDSDLAAVCAAHGARLVEVENGFFSRMNNVAAGRAQGEVLLFLNDDTRVESRDWIETMLAWLELPGVAAVGPKLVYPDGRVQFTRVVMGIRTDGVPYFFDPFDHFGMPYLYGFSVDVATEVSSVSGGCMLVRREEFLDQGGFPEGEFATSYQDVAWSVAVRRGGRRILYTPHAVITHWGSFSKKKDERLLEREIRIATRFFASNLPELARCDRYWSPNLLEPGGLMEPPRFPGLPRFPRERM
jgi:GT2 family glycosyltransferase